MKAAGQSMIIPESAPDSPDQSSAIRLAFLGQFAILSGAGEPLPPIRQHKLIGILVLAALSPTRSVPAAHAVRLLWGESDARLARRSLNQLLHQARQLYPGLLVRTRTDDRIALGEGVSSDLAALGAGSIFDEATSPPDSQSCELLPGFSITGCPAFDDLLDNARASVAGTISKAALRRAAAERGSGRLAWAGLAYRLDRASEDTGIAYLAEVAAANGNAACWAAFTAHRDWLAEHFDLPPSASLRRAVLELCRDASPVASGAPVVSGEPVPSGDPVASVGPIVPIAAATEPPAPVRSFSPDPPAAAEPGQVPPIQRRPGRAARWLQGAAAMVLLALLSWLVVQQAGSPELRADPATPGPTIQLEYGLGNETLDSAVNAVVHHLASHGIHAEVRPVRARAAAAGVLLSGGTSAALPRLLPIDLGATGTALAHEQAVLFDSALALTAGPPSDAARVSRSRKRSAPLEQATARFDEAVRMVASGGANAALLLLASADSMARAAAAAKSSDSDAPLLRSRIAQHTFWTQFASGAKPDRQLLAWAVRHATSALALGGGSEALLARADANFSLWNFGQAGAAAAGEAALRDYGAMVHQDPSHALAWARLAAIYHSQGRLSDAYTAALHSLENSPGRHGEQSYMALYLASLDLQDMQRARRWCEELNFHYPRAWASAACGFMNAWADPTLPMPSGGTALYDAPTALRPALEHRVALLAAGASLARGNRGHAAVRTLRPQLAADPEAEPILAGILAQQGQLDSARAVLNAYIAATPARRSAQYRPWLAALR